MYRELIFNFIENADAKNIKYLANSFALWLSEEDCRRFVEIYELAPSSEENDG